MQTPNVSPTWPELGWSDEITACWERGPRSQQAKVLDRALELVKSVPYHVTLRWLFYGLWQEGWFTGKQATQRASAKKRAYEDFSSLMSRLRHSPDGIQERWPIELADDRRDPIHRTQGFESAEEWLGYERQRMACNIDKMVGQDHYVMVAFEAEAMLSQFRYYTESYGVSLWPFSGAASIPYKKRLAKHIDWINDNFEMPVIILYFGDYDQKGLEIPESAFRHVRKWADARFCAYRAGLNHDQVDRYHIEEDVDNPGKFQWEAVRDDASREIITGALDSLLLQGTIRAIEAEQARATGLTRAALETVHLGA